MESTTQKEFITKAKAGIYYLLAIWDDMKAIIDGKNVDINTETLPQILEELDTSESEYRRLENNGGNLRFKTPTGYSYLDLVGAKAWRYKDFYIMQYTYENNDVFVIYHNH